MRAVLWIFVALLVGLLTPIIFLAAGGAFIVAGQTIRMETAAPPPAAPPVSSTPRRATASGLPPGSTSSDEPPDTRSPAPNVKSAAPAPSKPGPALDMSNSYGIGTLFVVVMPK
jgi:hypothetical protein